MPKVGKMKFPYTEQGMREAQNYSKQSGKPMQVEGNYSHGGMVKPMRPMYKHGGKVMPKYKGGGIVRGEEIMERLAKIATLYRPTPEIVVYGDGTVEGGPASYPEEGEMAKELGKEAGKLGKAGKKKSKSKTKKRRY